MSLLIYLYVSRIRCPPCRFLERLRVFDIIDDIVEGTLGMIDGIFETDKPEDSSIDDKISSIIDNSVAGSSIKSCFPLQQLKQQTSLQKYFLNRKITLVLHIATTKIIGPYNEKSRHFLEVYGSNEKILG